MSHEENVRLNAACARAKALVEAVRKLAHEGKDLSAGTPAAVNVLVDWDHERQKWRAWVDYGHWYNDDLLDAVRYEHHAAAGPADAVEELLVVLVRRLSAVARRWERRAQALREPLARAADGLPVTVTDPDVVPLRDAGVREGKWAEKLLAAGAVTSERLATAFYDAHLDAVGVYFDHFRVLYPVDSP